MEQGSEPELTSGQDVGVGSSTKRGRKPYTPPKLQILGDIRDLTMGGSPGIGDSGATMPEFPAGWPG